MIIRHIKDSDVEAFYYMLCKLDEETEYMLYEPGERRKTVKDLFPLKQKLKAASSGQSLLLVALNDSEELIGYISAERGKLNRIAHTAYIVVGILKKYRRQGIGTEFFNILDSWAKANNIVRLELTVECINIDAINLYKKNGYIVEGLRPKSIKANGKFIDEYYMGKIIN